MKIYVVSHKKFEKPVDDSIYVPLQVGTSLHGELDSRWEFDNSGENISKKNLSYNELTGLYWIWKNAEEDIVGLCHYRRYFVSPGGKIGNLLFGCQRGFLKEEDIRRILKKKELIVHNKTFFLQGNRNQYLESQKYPNDIFLLRDVLSARRPDYVEAYDLVMKDRRCHLLNMLIGKKAMIDQYCEWLFDILFETEKRLQENGEEDFQRRMGMLGERMLDIWLIKNHILYQEMCSINTERKDWKFW